MTLFRDLTERSGIGIGYAYVAAFRESGTRREHRLVEQFRWRAGTGPRVVLRSTLEERFATGRDTAWRGGQQVRVLLPVAAKGRLTAVASNEVFVRLGKVGAARRELDNRAFIGIAHTLTARTHVEAGYMHVSARHASSRPTRSHILVVALTASR